MKKRLIAAVGLGAGLLAAVAAFDGPAKAAPLQAQTKLRTASGEQIGSVTFRDDPRADVITVKVNLDVPIGATAMPAFHGLHVHANDNPANGSGCLADPAAPANTWFLSADGHYKHLVTDTHPGHAGDLPSVHVNTDGSAEMKMTKDGLTPSELVGRVVILHAGPDNFGNVPIGPGADQYSANAPEAVAKTQATGNAGDRFACGVIVLT